jgi:hypothetical protein
MIGEIDRPHSALTQLAHNPVCLMDQHPRLQFTNLTQNPTVGRAARQLIVVAGFALWTELHIQAGRRSPSCGSAIVTARSRFRQPDFLKRLLETADRNALFNSTRTGDGS